jgi:hypothetical protein
MTTCHGFCPIADPNASLQLVQPNSKATNNLDSTAVDSTRDAVCDIRLSPFCSDLREGYSGVPFHSI